MRRGLLICLLCLVALASGSARADSAAADGELVEIVVGLSQKPLGTTRWAAGRQLQSRTMISSQAALVRRIEDTIPAAQIRWRYRLPPHRAAALVPPPP